MNGRSRAIRIPKEFDFDSDEVVIRKEADGTLVVRPLRQKRSPSELIAWLRRQPPLEEEFPEIDDPPPEPIELDWPE